MSTNRRKSTPPALETVKPAQQLEGSSSSSSNSSSKKSKKLQKKTSKRNQDTTMSSSSIQSASIPRTGSFGIPGQAPSLSVSSTTHALDSTKTVPTQDSFTHETMDAPSNNAITSPDPTKSPTKTTTTTTTVLPSTLSPLKHHKSPPSVRRAMSNRRQFRDYWRQDPAAMSSKRLLRADSTTSNPISDDSDSRDERQYRRKLAQVGSPMGDSTRKKMLLNSTTAMSPGSFSSNKRSKFLSSSQMTSTTMTAVDSIKTTSKIPPVQDNVYAYQYDTATPGAVMSGGLVDDEGLYAKTMMKEFMDVSDKDGTIDANLAKKGQSLGGKGADGTGGTAFGQTGHTTGTGTAGQSYGTGYNQRRRRRPPGAFHVAGRAFGDVPYWQRREFLEDSSPSNASEPANVESDLAIPSGNTENNDDNMRGVMVMPHHYDDEVPEVFVVLANNNGTGGQLTPVPQGGDGFYSDDSNDKQQQQDQGNKTCRFRLILVGVLVLLGAVVATAVPLSIRNRNKGTGAITMMQDGPGMDTISPLPTRSVSPTSSPTAAPTASPLMRLTVIYEETDIDAFATVDLHDNFLASGSPSFDREVGRVRVQEILMDSAMVVTGTTQIGQKFIGEKRNDIVGKFVAVGEDVSAGRLILATAFPDHDGTTSNVFGRDGAFVTVQELVDGTFRQRGTNLVSSLSPGTGTTNNPPRITGMDMSTDGVVVAVVSETFASQGPTRIDVFEWDSARATWTTRPSISPEQTNVKVALSGDGSVLLYGGVSPSSRATALFFQNNQYSPIPNCEDMSVSGSYPLQEVAVSEDGSTLAFASASTLQVYDISDKSNGIRRPLLPMNDNGVAQLNIDVGLVKDGRFVLCTSTANGLPVVVRAFEFDRDHPDGDANGWVKRGMDQLRDYEDTNAEEVVMSVAGSSFVVAGGGVARLYNLNVAGV